MIDAIRRHAAQAARRLRRDPAFAAAAVATLSLGIAFAATMLSLFKAVLIDPLPFRDPARLVFVWSDMTSAGYPRGPMSGPELGDLRARATSLSQVEAIWATTATISGDGEPEMLRIGLVTASFFPMLAAPPARGRLLTADEEDGVLLSHTLWLRRFGGDTTLVGRRVTINGTPATVVGIMPAGFKLWLPPDAGVPDDLDAWRLFPWGVTDSPRGQMFLRVVARLAPGATLGSAQREVAEIARRIGTEFPDYGRLGRRFAVVGFVADGVRGLGPILRLLLAGAALLLVTAVLNVLALVVTRTIRQRRDSAVRIALGGGRGDLFATGLAEGVIVGGFSAILGLGLASLGIRVLLATRPFGLSRIDGTTLDGAVATTTLVLVAGIALLLGRAPLWAVGRQSVAAALRADDRGSRGALSLRLRTALVAAQVAFATALLTASLLLSRTMVNVGTVDPGFRAERVVTFRVPLSDRYGEAATANSFGRLLLDRLRAIPGVEAAGAISHLPFDNVPNWSTTWLSEKGLDDSEARRADARAVTPGYFATVGTELIAGRDFAEADDEGATPVVIVDESLARRAWPNATAIGKSLAVDPFVTGHATLEATVVGVVRHVRHLDIAQEVREQVYFAARQVRRNPMAYAVRAAGRVDPAIRAAINELDASLAVADVSPLHAALDHARAPSRFVAGLASLFGIGALALASVGLFGTVGYSVTTRRSEFGVRLALGADPARLRCQVLREAFRIVVAGLAIGLLIGMGVGWLSRSLLYGVSFLDPASWILSVALLGALASVASWIPAARAAATSPVESLHTD